LVEAIRPLSSSKKRGGLDAAPDNRSLHGCDEGPILVFAGAIP
jgi:hypothetical protein